MAVANGSAAICRRLLFPLIIVVALSSLVEVRGSPCSDEVSLFPQPKQLVSRGGSLLIPDDIECFLVVGAKATHAEEYAAERLRTLVSRRFNRKLSIVAENAVPSNAGPKIVVGQLETNSLLEGVCRAHKVSVRGDGPKPRRDAYVLEVIPSENTIVVVGANERGVIYGAQTLFKLIRSCRGGLRVANVSIGDWPSIAWRGGRGINQATPEEMDAWVWCGFNFARAAKPANDDWRALERAIAEAHRRGIFVYAYVTTAVKPAQFDEVIRDYEKMIDCGADGLWMSFDDYGPGENTVQLMKRVLELGKRHSVTGRKIAITPPLGDYNEIDRPFNRERCRIKGMAEAVWFFTEVPSRDGLQSARRVGLRSLPAWWHNWPRVEGSFSHASYGPRSLRADKKRPYMEVPPLIWGWGHPDYDRLRQADLWTDTVLACSPPGLPLYYSAPLGFWAWEPEHHDFTSCRAAIYDAVYGPKCAPLASRYDETRHLLRNYFTVPSNVGGLPEKFPARLRDSADREECNRLISTLESLAAEITRSAPKETTLRAEHLEAEYLEPMQADAAIARALFTTDFPENWWWEHEGEVLQLAASGNTDAATRLAIEKSDVLTRQLRVIDEKLSPLLDMKGYLEFWGRRASVYAAGDLVRAAELFHDQPGSLSPECEAVKKYVSALASPPTSGSVVFEALPDQLARSIRRSGPWMAALYQTHAGSGVHMAFPGQRDSRAGDYCSVSLRAGVPVSEGRKVVRFLLYCDPFGTARAGYNMRQGMRSLQVLCNGKVVWREDALVAGKRDDLWRSVDITDAVPGDGNLELTLRIFDETPFRSYPVLSNVGPSEQSQGLNRWDPTSYQTYLLIGPVQIVQADD